MKVELKNVRTVKSLSHETDCFEASVYIDGQKAGSVWNTGNGGSNCYHPTTLWQRIEEYAKTLPPTTIEGHEKTFPQTADCVIGESLTDALYLKDMRSTLKKRVLWVNSAGHVMQTKPLKPERHAALLACSEAKLRTLLPIADCPNAPILNLLPDDEALAHYRANA